MKKNKKLFSNKLVNSNDNDAILKRIFDGKPKNVNPLKEIPEPQITLYGFMDVTNSIFFDTEEEIINYIKNNKPSSGNICVIEFLGEVAGRTDVIRKSIQNGVSNLYTVINEEAYAVYNEERSIYRGEFVWEYNYGKIDKLYSAFREKGVIFQNDIYDKSNNKTIKKTL